MTARTVVATLVLAAGVAACADDISDPPYHAGGPLRVVNGSASDVSVIVDGTTQIASLAAGSLSSDVAVRFGSHQVTLRPVGGSAGTGIPVTTTLTAPTYVAVLGTAPGAVSGMALADTGAIPAAGKSKLLAVHLAAKAPPLWVWRIQPDFPSPVRFMFPHPYGASTPYIEAAPGTWQVIVTPENGDPTRDVLGRLSIAVAANQARRVVVLDSIGGKVRIVPLDQP